MQLAPQIVYRHLIPTRSVEARIQAEIAALEKFFDRIQSCRVMVEPSGEQHETGNQYHVRIDLAVPGRSIVVGRDPGDDAAHEDLHVAIRDSFAAARRLLADHAREARGEVKEHVSAERHGEVARLMPDKGFGFVRALDGHEVYFHKNSVSRDRFEDLHVGSWVAFTEEEGREGPQAARLHLDRTLRPPSDVIPGATSEAPRS
jgi:cold shock CspA family protein